MKRRVAILLLACMPLVGAGLLAGVRQQQTDVVLTVTVHSAVVLQWNASTSTGVVGYNVYRGTAHGGPYKVIDSRDNTLDYTDSPGPGTFYYVVTAVDDKNNESGFSNEVSAVAPH